MTDHELPGGSAPAGEIFTPSEGVAPETQGWAVPAPVPEPPKPGSRIYTLPNVILTPHVAGSMAAECRRMGRYAVEMCQCYLAGKPMKWQLNKKMAETMA